MATITTSTHKILDSAGNLANGVIYFTQTKRFVTSDALVTTAQGQMAVRDGEFVRSLVIPETPADEYVKVVEVFGPNPSARVPVTWWTHVGALSSYEYTDLPEDVAPSGGSGPTLTSIDDLSDVDTSTVAPTDGQALVWDNANSQWEPGTVSGGGGPLFADPNADRIAFWDDSAGAFAPLTHSAPLSISGTTLSVSAATTSAQGAVELATTAETTTGTDTTRATTPAGVKAVADTKANTSHTHAASDITSGTVATARLGSGTADSTTFLRGDNTWATPAGGGGTDNGALAPTSATMYWQMIPYGGSTAAADTAGDEFAIQMPLQAQTLAAVSTWIQTAAASQFVVIGFRKIGSNGIPGSVEGQVALPADSTGRSTVTGLSIALSGGLYAVCFATTGSAQFRAGPNTAFQFGGYGGGLHTVGALETNRTHSIRNGNALSGSTLAASWSLSSVTTSVLPPIIAVRRSS